MPPSAVGNSDSVSRRRQRSVRATGPPPRSVTRSRIYPAFPGRSEANTTLKPRPSRLRWIQPLDNNDHVLIEWTSRFSSLRSVSRFEDAERIHRASASGLRSPGTGKQSPSSNCA